MGHLQFLMAVVLPLFASLAITKAFAAGTWEWASARFPVKLALLSWHDLLFVLGWTAAGFFALLLFERHPKGRRLARIAFISFSTLLVVYAIASVWIYLALRMYLTYPLLMMAGEDARSSIVPYLTVLSVGALAAGPVLYLAAVWMLLRWPQMARPRTYWFIVPVVAIYAVTGHFGYARWCAGGPNEGLAMNPHWVLLSSIPSSLFRVPSLDRTNHGPASFTDDFLTHGQRAPAGGKAPPPIVKNVVLVVLESTSTQFLGVYHNQYPTTPNLNAEESNSLIFTNVYSNDGYTLQSFMPLILSLYPGVGWEIYASSHPHLQGTSAAQVLHDRGYRTAFMTSAMLDFRGSRRFFDHRGFDLVRGCEDFQKAGIGSMVSSWGMDDPPLFDALLNWIGQETAKPFFAVVWTQQTHHPYSLAPYQQPIRFALAERTGQQDRLLNFYLNDIRIADQQLGRLFAFLRERGLADDTLVVVTGDHGEAFGFPHPWMFHGTALYQESVNVPCILWNPKAFAGRSRSATVGAHVDLNPTIFELLGIAPPAAWQGTSLLDPTRSPRAYFSCNTGNLLEGLRDGSEKFIFNVTLAREELYNIDADPDEQRNLAPQSPDKCREYRQRLSAWAAFERTHLKELTNRPQ